MKIYYFTIYIVSCPYGHTKKKKKKYVLLSLTKCRNFRAQIACEQFLSFMGMHVPSSALTQKTVSTIIRIYNFSFHWILPTISNLWEDNDQVTAVTTDSTLNPFIPTSISSINIIYDWKYITDRIILLVAQLFFNVKEAGETFSWS
jgi:hypothetical protein